MVDEEAIFFENVSDKLFKIFNIHEIIQNYQKIVNTNIKDL